MDKRVFVQLNGARKVTGVLRGFDPFMNLVLDEAVEETKPSEKTPIGMVVRPKKNIRDNLCAFDIFPSL